MAKFTKANYQTLYEIAAKTPGILPFPGDTPKARAERIRKVKQGGWKAFEFLATTYFPHVCTLDFCDAHKEMFQFTEQNSDGLTGITGFRGLAKTVLMSPLYTIYRVIHGDRYIINTAADKDLAEERSAFIYNELTSNQRLLNDFPSLMVIEGIKDDFFLKNKTRIRARSIKQAHRGTLNPKTAKRVNLIVCDDIDQESNVGNMDIGRRKMKKIIEELLGALDPAKGGRVIWLGNLTHPNFGICQYEDLLTSEIKSEEPDSKPEQREHLISGKKALLRYPLEVLRGGKIVSRWEAQYPTASLPELRKTYGNTGYQREMLGMKVIEGNIFKNDWFATFRDVPNKIKQAVLYADPAWGKKGCFKSIIGIADDNYKYFMTTAWVRQGANSLFFRAYFDAFMMMSHKYGGRFRAGMEANYGQTRLWDDFDDWCEKEKLNKISHRIKKIYSRDNKNLRIEEVTTVIENGKLLFPIGQDMHILKSQFLTYPQGFIDGPDGTAGACRMLNSYGKKKGVKARRIGR